MHQLCLAHVRTATLDPRCPECGANEAGFPRPSACPHGMMRACPRGCGTPCVHGRWHEGRDCP
eukprot:10041563-Lingulodinium_polyedra.AAC.1